MLTLLYFFLAEPVRSSPPPSKASGRIQVSFIQASSANGSPSLGMPQGDRDVISVSSQVAWKGRLLMKSAH